MQNPLWDSLDRSPRRASFAEQHALDRAAAVAWARGLFSDGYFIVLDTETTGLDTTPNNERKGSEVVQIGIVAPDGGVLLDALVKAQEPMSDGAYRVHGIADGNLALAASFPEIDPTLRALVNRRRVIVYNSGYDVAILTACRARYGLPPYNAAGWECLMHKYSAA
jgi:DNA polymerase III epsilon subunit-like protein